MDLLNCSSDKYWKQKMQCRNVIDLRLFNVAALRTSLMWDAEGKNRAPFPKNLKNGVRKTTLTE